MLVISPEQVHQTLSFESVIDELQKGFAKPAGTPPRNVYSLTESSADAFAVLPAWNDEYIGVKAFTYFPNNASNGYESLYSKIILFERAHGVPLALVDGTSVTLWRTASVSALASKYLSRTNAKHLVFFGTGNLAPYMIKAHLAVRDLNQVTVIARNTNKAAQLIDELRPLYPNVKFAIGTSNQSTIANADIVSCATGSHTPLFEGSWLKEGAHVDLIGNHHADCSECDITTITRGSVFVDSKVNVLKEAGELLIPMEQGLFTKSDVIAQLSEMHDMTWQRQNEEITVFKSVGMALSDLITASLVYRLNS
ncbi:ornithine cyclodeaminase family protein [Pseudoalteromonas sp. MMG022]|uniref:ornithine cyclodeaminase family protein n=1 Tax=Pseudoalteromonas sp. MMG022 TaxID=2909978 RepID=UPI001F23EDE3|nr:ornithine cyclodeaminase family protein [Pseudoalteromonas sp. MMG022]MCF6434017.1 ornithine cyclodeaminase family protein [Pseudoalteromonas sp. MMG022]